MVRDGLLSLPTWFSRDFIDDVLYSVCVQSCFFILPSLSIQPAHPFHVTKKLRNCVLSFRRYGTALPLNVNAIAWPQAPTSIAQWWRLPHSRKTPQRAPPSEELDPATITFSLFYCELRAIIYRRHWRHDLQSHLFSGKSTKTAATTAALFDSNMHQIVCRLRLSPNPTAWGSLQRSPRPPSCI